VDISVSEKYNASTFRVNICSSEELVGLYRQAGKAGHSDPEYDESMFLQNITCLSEYEA
jgi:hypothetical protein